MSTDRGIVLVYNGANHPRTGDPSIPAFAYTPGQALFDGSDPAACIARTCGPFLDPAVTDAAAGQVGNVCFGQGLVCRDERWLLYSGLADSRVGLATAPVGAPGFRQLEG